MEANEVISMMDEASANQVQLRVMNRHAMFHLSLVSQNNCSVFRTTKDSICATLFCKQKEMDDMKSDINVVPLMKFNSVLGQKEIDYKFKNVDEVLSVLLTENHLLTNFP